MVVHLSSSIPCIFVLLNRHQSIFHCFVDQCVDTGYEEVDGTKQSLAILTQQLLCFCIIPKLILQRNTEVLPANVMTCHVIWGDSAILYLQLWGLLAEVSEGIS